MGVVCGAGPAGPDGFVREFTVATFVVNRGRLLLLWHRKHSMWLPPGGHIEAGELPDDAAVREVLEETGVAVRLVGERGLDVSYPPQLILPYGVQVENIRPGVSTSTWSTSPSRSTRTARCPASAPPATAPVGMTAPSSPTWEPTTRSGDGSPAPSARSRDVGPRSP
jgi:hypothetical protein